MAGFRDRRVLVVGDVILDRYVWGKVSRISPEAPVPVVEVSREYARPGGAANVSCNVQSLGGQAILAGVVGEDGASEELVSLLAGMGIGTEGLVCRADTQTIAKTRVFAEHQQVVRVDREPPAPLTEGAAGELCRKVAALAGGVDAVIVEDYGKGAVSQEVVDGVLAAASGPGVPVGFDPTANHSLSFSKLALATPNLKEACAAAGRPGPRVKGGPLSASGLQEMAETLLGNWHAELLIITLGSDGMFLATAGQPGQVIATKAREVYDVSGAGDTVIAAAMLAVGSGATHVEAASLANYAAGVVVGKLGTATCEPSELMDCFRVTE